MYFVLYSNYDKYRQPQKNGILHIVTNDMKQIINKNKQSGVSGIIKHPLFRKYKLRVWLFMIVDHFGATLGVFELANYLVSVGREDCKCSYD